MAGLVLLAGLRVAAPSALAAQFQSLETRDLRLVYTSPLQSFPAAADPTPGTWSVKLVPHRRETEYEWLVLVVDRATFRLRRLITADAQGGESAFTFSDVRENVGIPDSAFRFTIPRGVDVVTHGQAGR